MVQLEVSLLQNGAVRRLACYRMVQGGGKKACTEWYSKRVGCYRMVQGGVTKLVTEWYREGLLSLLQNGIVRGKLVTEWHSQRLALIQNCTGKDY